MLTTTRQDVNATITQGGNPAPCEPNELVARYQQILSERRLNWTSHLSLKLQAATDQHQAMTEELESLAASDPKKFSPDQIWVLIRAIKVQSQILQLYVGEALVDV